MNAFRFTLVSNMHAKMKSHDSVSFIKRLYVFLIIAPLFISVQGLHAENTAELDKLKGSQISVLAIDMPQYLGFS